MTFLDRVYIYQCSKCGETRSRSFVNHTSNSVPGELSRVCGGDVYRQAYQLTGEPVKL